MAREKADGLDPGWTGYVQEKIAWSLDTLITTGAAKRMYVAAAGDVAFELQDGSVLTRTFLAKTELTGYAIVKVKTTGTTVASPATNIELYR